MLSHLGLFTPAARATPASPSEQNSEAEGAFYGEVGIDLYWLPLGAGGHSVRWNGRIFEWMLIHEAPAIVGRQTPSALAHSGEQRAVQAA